MAGKLKGIKTMQVEQVKSKSVETEQTNDSSKAVQILTSTKKTRKEPKFYISHHHGHGKVSGKVVVKKGDKIEYVDRKLGDKLVMSEGWSYGKKTEWKKLVRDV